MAQFRTDSHRYLNNGNTIFEVVMLADQYGNQVGSANPTGVALDAFGRARTSQPFTLFDSSHRYRDNGLWSTANTAGSDYAFSANEGLVNLNVNTTANTEVIRETTKVFSYQPGKSLQVLNTFAMSPAKAGLRQRIGYFGAQNGIYIEQDGTEISFVKRSFVSGSIVETKVLQSDWNIDPLDGTGSSRLILDLSKAQIMWCDIEWLGVGTVRMGFVIDGKLIHCHSFHHANIEPTTYITTASLPLRYEIKNTSATSSNSTLKQICSTVISEGGYGLVGTQQSIGNPINSPRTLGTAGTFYPVISLRLKASPNRLDTIAVLSKLSAMPITSGNYNWKIQEAGTTTGGTWISAEADSSVEYNLTGVSFSGGRTLASGFFSAVNQGRTQIDVPKEALFKFQLERNGLTSTPFELTLIVASDSSSDTLVASMDWEEITR
jgi:hypothetical protein